MTNQILPSPLVLAPGPVQLHPEIQAVLAQPMIHHRTPEFDRILQEVLQELRWVFKTQQPVFILSSTGSGGMEGLLTNTLSPGDAVLAIDSGKFGERWAEMAQILGAQVDVLKVPWGQAVSLQEWEAKIRSKKYALALCQACETSTAVAHPIQDMARILRSQSPETLFLVDAITALGACPMPMDEWDLDGLVGGSQKAFMLPTGLSFVCLSERAWRKKKHNTNNGKAVPQYYFDLDRELAANKKNSTFFSSSVTLIRALQVALKQIWKLDPNPEKAFNVHLQAIAQRALDFRILSQEMGWDLYSQSPAPALTALVPSKKWGTLDLKIFREDLEAQYGITVMGGQDQLLGKILRIGHMGYLTGADHVRLFHALEALLKNRLSQPLFSTAKQRENWIHRIETAYGTPYPIDNRPQEKYK